MTHRAQHVSSSTSFARRPTMAAAIAAIALASVVAIACAFAFTFAGPAVAAHQLRLAVSNGPVSLPIYVAEARGFFADEGLQVQIGSCNSGRDCFEQMASGHADVATAAELLMTVNALQGSNSAIVATISASARHIKLLARRSAGISGPDDLRGKRVASVAGTSAHYFLDSWLLFNAIDRAQVTVSSLPPQQLLPALQRSDVDALAIWEPLAGQAAAALGTDAVRLPSPRVYTQHFSLIAARDAIDHRRGDLIKLLRALRSAETFIAQQPLLAAQLLTARTGPVGADALAEHDFRLALPQSLIATMDAEARWAVQGGVVPPPPRSVNLLRNIEPSLLREVAPSAVGLVH